VKLKLEPVLFVGKLSKEPKNLRGFLEQHARLLSESAIYQFFFQDALGAFHLISLWPTQKDLINSLRQLDLPETDLQSQIYLGDKSPTNHLKTIFEPWNPKFLTTPEAGYCFHPKYRNSSLNKGI
jgi:hypothetical protein